ncbi:HTH-type transcriptional regulator/antitoxin HigA [Collimonas sp. PA-H2]|uniref:ImmA/IrrE family metallo-endopeptidase n=1 Tax=Collimonas sp. PA-H2 TaxID=1881062 RepID=UPI000BF51941|nr:ImmA/IrrE family metallo-endopeptidase [Collimonas sp. PA-H2]PFH08804.1 HTH-type transcriptional regulator/antitoxin HigA [Collimonas sp. PA-H2]
MEYRILKSETEHQTALLEAEGLVALDPPTGSTEGDRLALLALLIEDYEKRAYQFEALDPIEIIEFRMAEQGLRQKDLVPLLGSRSRVSEVLGGKRPLTVQMIRALSSGLGIPADALIGREPVPSRDSESNVEEIDWKRFPYREMERRGWFSAAKISGKNAEEMLRSFLTQIVPSRQVPIMFRRRFRGDKLDEKAYYSTLAWTARVLMRAKDVENDLPKFDPGKISADTLRDLARLSWFSNGPRLAVEFLSKCGIAVIVEPRLPNAVIDGAAMLSERGTPVIGLTLRIDRTDYFWFTLMHEVAHVWRHLNTADEAFIDRIERIASTEKSEQKENEANRIARDSFIRRAVWERSSARLAPTNQSIQELADSLHIHPAIVAGRIQFESGHYEHFREFLEQGLVQQHFQ